MEKTTHVMVHELLHFVQCQDDNELYKEWIANMSNALNYQEREVDDIYRPGMKFYAEPGMNDLMDPINSAISPARHNPRGIDFMAADEHQVEFLSWLVTDVKLAEQFAAHAETIQIEYIQELLKGQ
jgi:hypothetical protein